MPQITPRTRRTLVRSRLLLPVLLVSLAACSAAPPAPIPRQSPPVVLPDPAARAESEKRYAVLVERIKVDPQPPLLAELRKVFVATERYRPYSSASEALTAPMFEDLETKSWKTGLEHATAALDLDYTDMWAHFGAMVCHRESGNRSQAAFHERVVTGLLDAIAATGNGKTADTAFRTHSTSELKAFLQLQGWEIQGQALTPPDESGRVFDIMGVRDPDSGKEMSLYFDITLQWALGFADMDVQTP